MILTPLRLLSTGCALVALMVAAPSLAQDVPASQVPDAGVPTQAEPAVLPPAIVVEAPPIDRTAEPEAPAIPAVWSPIPKRPTVSRPTASILSGRLASFRGDRTTGAALLAQAQSLVPEQPVLADEAFREGLFAGDLDEVARLTPLVEPDPATGRSRGAGHGCGSVAAARRRPACSRPCIRQADSSDLFGVGVRFLTPIVAAGAGDWADGPVPRCRCAARPVRLHPSPEPRPAAGAPSASSMRQRSNTRRCWHDTDRDAVRRRGLWRFPGASRAARTKPSSSMTPPWPPDLQTRPSSPPVHALPAGDARPPCASPERPCGRRPELHRGRRAGQAEASETCAIIYPRLARSLRP